MDSAMPRYFIAFLLLSAALSVHLAAQEDDYPDNPYQSPSPSPSYGISNKPGVSSIASSPAPSTLALSPDESPVGSPDAGSNGSPYDNDTDGENYKYPGSPPSPPPSHQPGGRSKAPPSPPPKAPKTPEAPDTDNGPKTITWCAVRDELSDCKSFIKKLNSDSNYTWSCVQKNSAFDCMQAIQKGKADVMSLEAGIAYIAFLKYEMKAIMMEEYSFFTKSYEAVAVVNKHMCEKNPHLSLKSFQGLKSCHSGYLTAAGWNYPVKFMLDSNLPPNSAKVNDKSAGKDLYAVTHFFSSTCAPSELEDKGLCSSCGNNGTCTDESFNYIGHAGAFRCLNEDIGDIAFVSSDTVQRLSSDGKHMQEWSTKPLDEFRYLCPQGGCKTINDNIGNCTFGMVPANVLMTRNAEPNSRRLEIVNRLLSASYKGLLYNPKNWNDHVLSSNTQHLVEVTELTRQVLGESVHVAQRVQNLEGNTTYANQLLASGSSKLPSLCHWCTIFLLALLCYGVNIL